MPTWLKNLIPYARGTLVGVAGFLGTRAGVQMTGADIPAWVLLLFAAVLGLTSVFFEQLAERLWNLYQIKKLKYFAGGILLLVLVLCLGWPWQRIQNLYAEIELKQPIISEIWMSEQDAEQFIIRKLQNESGREVFDWRVRYLLKWQTYRNNLGRFRCKGDSTWRRLTLDELREEPNFGQYDGTKLLSEFIGCKIQYSTEYIYRLDWVEIDKESDVKPPNPESSGSH